MDIKKILSDNKRKIRDLSLSIGATAVLNIVIQFALYPYLERNLGEERYGVALSILSLVAILAGTLGTSANYSRMVISTDVEHSNGDYNLLLLVVSFVLGLGGIFYLRYLGINSVVPAILFVALTVLTALRYYSDVGFRMKADFLRYMLYYVMISLGYLVGMTVYRASGEWMTALIVGEAFGILFVVFFGTLYRTSVLRPSRNFLLVVKSMGFLVLSTLIENLTLNADRLLLMVMSGGVAVSVYYVASLFGKVVAMLSVPINSIIISYLVKYKGGLTRKLWTVAISAVFVLGMLAFGGCVIVSPFFLKMLYPDIYTEAARYVAPAILGQIFYFTSGILLVMLLRFRGEKKQFLFNLGYLVEFVVIVLVGTWQGGLDGFVYASLIANAIRFFAVLLFGYLPQKSDKKLAQ
jgi:O-antigen/teichoic acid export membrane protein